MGEQNPIVAAVLEDKVVQAAIGHESVTKPSGTSTQTTSQISDKTTVTTSRGDIVATPTTTEEQDKVSHGQRSINLIWETTQRFIALAVVSASLLVSMFLAVRGEADSKTAAFVFIYGVSNLVIGFYFGRTNHQKIGGVEQGR